MERTRGNASCDVVFFLLPAVLVRFRTVDLSNGSPTWQLAHTIGVFATLVASFALGDVCLVSVATARALSQIPRPRWMRNSTCPASMEVPMDNRGLRALLIPRKKVPCNR